MLVRIGESEKEPRFVNVRLVILVIIQSISFDIHQSKCSVCVQNVTGISLGGAANNWRSTLRPNEERYEEQRREAPTQLSQRDGKSCPMLR